MYFYVQSVSEISSFDIAKQVYNVIKKKYKNNFYAMFARTKRKQFSITIKVVSLLNSLHNFVRLSSSLRISKINVKIFFYVNIDFLQNT